MSNEPVEISTIRNYLLGDLPEAEKEKVEKSYFASPQEVDEVWAVFGEITEEYLSGALSEDESRRFERRLQAAPALREMFENEKALFDYAARIAAGPPRQTEIGALIGGAGWRGRPPSAFFKPTRLMAAGAVALIALAALITWFALRTREGPRPVTPTQLQKDPQQTAAKDQKPPDNIVQPSAGPQRLRQHERDANEKTVTFLLLAAGVRGEQSDPILKIPAQKDTVQLELELSDDDCAAFSATLRAESDVELRRWNNQRARRGHSILRTVVLRARVDSLNNGGYVIRLDCVSGHKNPVPAREYRFKIEKNA